MNIVLFYKKVKKLIAFMAGKRQRKGMKNIESEEIVLVIFSALFSWGEANGAKKAICEKLDALVARGIPINFLTTHGDSRPHMLAIQSRNWGMEHFAAIPLVSARKFMQVPDGYKFYVGAGRKLPNAGQKNCSVEELMDSSVEDLVNKFNQPAAANQPAASKDHLKFIP
jgi:hypothetical protein